MYRFDTLPDVTSDGLQSRSLPLQWVGMEQVDVPVSVPVGTGLVQRLAAKANIFVSLDDAAAKGIHMSRLHAILNRLGEEPLNKALMDSLLSDSVESQGGISKSARIDLTFDLLLEKPALLSGKVGHQAYHIVISGRVDEDRHTYQLEVTIPYSSTCPCSASLAQQLYAQAIDEKFADERIDKAALLDWIQSDDGSVATPHAQRSYAYLKLTTDSNPWPDLAALIKRLETVIGTPVQTAVKRMDEQQFAKLNGENLMFCEDAARRIKQELESMTGLTDYWFKVEHQESLHPHNAVAIDRKR
ncbi:MAG: GTP cyclohydrolase FolE2 [Pseudomonadota bacterium]